MENIRIVEVGPRDGLQNVSKTIPTEKKVEFIGDKVGKFDLQNKIRVTLNSGENLDLKHLRRNFLTNSSCGVCGKTSMDSLEIICKTKINKDAPKIKNSLITEIPDLLRQSQSEFSKTGGIHASALFNKEGKSIVIKEDVGRHNALDKLLATVLKILFLIPKINS